MKLLLDTHTFLWFAAGDRRLSANAKALIEDPHNEAWLSPASLWEIAIKVSIGKLGLIAPFDVVIPQYMNDNDINLLDIAIAHTSAVVALPFDHRDPFDRLIIAQAIVENFSIVSNDTAFDSYPITRLW
jgi:PIN domain nuclease of toxin-antitoxin system